jgi:subtilisin
MKMEIIRLKTKIITILLLLIMLSSLATTGIASSAPDKKVQVIVGFKDLPDAALVQAHGGEKKYEYNSIHAIAATMSIQQIEELKKNPKVAYVEEDIVFQASEYNQNGIEDWGMNKIGAIDVHTSNNGSGVKVAILDTGINMYHEDLAGNYKGGKNYVNPLIDPIDDNGHGTHCAGIIAAAFNNIAVGGVAPEAEIYAYKVLDSRGSGTTANIVKAIGDAVTAGVKVISMSFGSSGFSQALSDACKYAFEKGVVLVAAAGNNGPAQIGSSTISYPAKFDSWVIAVGATDNADKLASFSSTGPELDVVAPGVTILSDYIDVSPSDKRNIDTLYMSGTSMACPHVAGTAALILSANPSLNPAEVQMFIQSTAKDLGDPGFDNSYGNGRINAYAAIGSPPAAPSSPRNLQTIAGDSKVSLSWSAPLSNGGSAIEHYDIYRDGTLMPGLQVTSLTCIDTSVTNGDKYSYEVTATNVIGESGKSNTATAIPASLKTMTITAVTDKLQYSRGSKVTITVTAKEDITSLPGVAVSTSIRSPSGSIVYNSQKTTASTGLAIFTYSLSRTATRGTYTVTTTASLSGYSPVTPITTSFKVS